MWCMGCDMVLLYSLTNSFIYINLYTIFSHYFSQFSFLSPSKRGKSERNLQYIGYLMIGIL